ncbi:MAG TPA: glycosyltransferase, partial [Acidobacteriota bacterium]|nr:glycosyltransferase [Acidobacteriota bacterium]
RKGFQEFLEALAKLRDIPMKVLVFGTKTVKIPTIENVDFRFLDRIHSLELLRLIYSASDTFVISSLHESFGQTALEAMACGTPITGFCTGGIPDMVRPGVTGLLADAGSAEDLAQKIRWMANHPNERTQMALNARQIVEQEFSLDVQARNYIELYESLIR